MFFWSVFAPTVSFKCSDNSAFQCFSFVTKEKSTLGAHVLPSAKSCWGGSHGGSIAQVYRY